jgi:hypothetical protein
MISISKNNKIKIMEFLLCYTKRIIYFPLKGLSFFSRYITDGATSGYRDKTYSVSGAKKSYPGLTYLIHNSPLKCDLNECIVFL